jgi:hypothetical protein
MVGRNLRLQKKYQCLNIGADPLYESSFIHPDPGRACHEVCSAETVQLIQRNQRTADEDDPVAQYQLILSAD